MGPNSTHIGDGSGTAASEGMEARLRKMLAGPSIAFGTAAVVVSYWAVVALHWEQTGWDFPVFYIAAALPTHSLYSRAAFAAYFQDHLAGLGVPHWARFVRPPLFSFLLRPIATLDYAHALWAWLAGGLGAYLASVAILIRRFHLPLFLLAAFVAFYPAIVGLISGQDNCLFLLAILGGWRLLEEKRDTLAGLALSLCLYKFNLVVLIPLLLLFQKRYRALTSFAIGAVLIASVSFAITPLRTYITALMEVPKETAGFFPFGLRGFSFVIGQTWCYPVLAVIVLVLCCWLFRRVPLTEAFSVAITGTLLIVPYVTWYDSTLLALPLAFIYARGSSRIRLACIAVLLASPLWPFLLTHLTVELLVLGYFILVVNPGLTRPHASKPSFVTAENRAKGKMQTALSRLPYQGQPIFV
jgi:hypothetical protein